MRLLLNPISQKRYDSIVKNPPQSILLIAPTGSGKSTILDNLSEDVTGKDNAGRIIELKPLEGKNSIGIEQVRELKRLLRLKSALKRVILIKNAGVMTIEAQNSLLKILEEPPKNAHFLMSVDTSNQVLDTITSRTSTWRLNPPTEKQLRDYFKNYPLDELNKALSIGSGRTGLICSMLKEQQTHPLIQSIDVAKEILAENRFERLLRIDLLNKDSTQAKLVIEALTLVCKSALEASAAKNSSSAQQWHKRLKSTTQAQRWLENNVQPKLVLSHLFIVL